MSKRKQNPTTQATEQAPEVQAISEAVATPKPKAAFRGAGFVAFREKHNPRWCDKAQANVHDNEDEIAEQLAYEIRTFGWWNSPLVLEHLGDRIALLQAKYATLNAGMVRMNLGNQIRASIRRRAKAAK